MGIWLMVKYLLSWSRAAVVPAAPGAVFAGDAKKTVQSLLTSLLGNDILEIPRKLGRKCKRQSNERPARRAETMAAPGL